MLIIRRATAADMPDGKPPSTTGIATKPTKVGLQFETAEKLIADFFDEIERILKERNDG
jgi:hypothetical protein